MKTKFCTSCNTNKLVSDFRLNKSKKDGLQTKCIVCDKIYAQEYYKRNKLRCITRSRDNKRKLSAKLATLKSKIGCVKCGEREPCCLDFHHKDPMEKDFDVGGTIHKTSWKTVLKEIEKCIILCKNCHAKIHKYGSLDNF